MTFMAFYRMNCSVFVKYMLVHWLKFHFLLSRIIWPIIDYLKKIFFFFKSLGRFFSFYNDLMTKWTLLYLVNLYFT